MAEQDPSMRGLPSRYRIEKELGRGAYGIVYLARDTEYDVMVAVKTVIPGASADAIARFHEEARIAARLNHPHIIEVRDRGDADGRPFYVMRYVDGPSLRELLESEGRLEVADAVRIGAAVGRALDHAHSMEVVHRDIKPANLLLTESGHVYVSDFGVARDLGRSDSSRLTVDGGALGTFVYMSPEQLDESGDIDGRSDLYSLGCVVYEMLAGRPPFTGRTWQALSYAKVHGVPEPVRKFCPDAPEGVGRALVRALEKRREDRPQSGLEFAQELESAVGPGPLLRALLVVAAWSRRHPVRWAAGVLSVLIAATVLVWPTWVGSTSLTAIRLHNAGLEAVAVWDLPLADSLFTAAAAADTGYARARFHRAQTGSWLGTPASEWQADAEYAGRHPSRLPKRWRPHAEPLMRLGDRAFPEACRLYDALLEAGDAGFATQYGRGECRRLDTAVLPDTTSVTGWSFRSSYWEALNAHRSAFLALPGEVEDLRSGVAAQLMRVLPVKGPELIPTYGVDGTLWVGYPAWVVPVAGGVGDTISLVPAPWGQSPSLTRGQETAAQWIRTTNLELASQLAEAFSESADALLARAAAAEALGEDEALPIVRRAIELAGADPPHELTAALVWLLVKQGLPDRIEMLEEARSVATAFVDRGPPRARSAAFTYARLMTLAGHPLRAAEWVGQGSEDPLSSASVTRSADALGLQLLLLSAVGAEGSVLDSLEAEVRGSIARHDLASEYAERKQRLLSLPAILAFPEHVSPAFADPDFVWGGVAVAQQALAAGDSAGARRAFDQIEYEGIPAYRLSPDILHAEARLLAQLGEPARAARRLGAALDSIAYSPAGHIRERTERVGALVPAMITLSRLHHETGNRPEAARWARAARTLWAGGDRLAEALLVRLPDV